MSSSASSSLLNSSLLHPLDLSVSPLISLVGSSSSSSSVLSGPVSPDPHVLYHAILPVGVAEPGKETVHMSLTLRVLSVSHSLPAPNSLHYLITKSLILEITSADDPFFLYTCELNENDFSALKRDQQLSIDFLQFPGEVIRLLELCRSAQLKAASAMDQGTYLALLNLHQPTIRPSAEASSSLFKIVVQSNFRHVDYLNLRVHSAAENELKKNIREKVSNLKQENAYCLSQYQQLAAAFQSLERECADAQDASGRAQLLHLERVNQIIEKHQNELNEQSNQHQLTLETTIREGRQRLDSLEQSLRGELKVVQDEFSKAKDDNAALKQKVAEQNIELENIKAALTASESACQRLQRQLADLSETSARQAEELVHSARLSAQQTLNIKLLEQEKADSEKFIASQQNMIEMEKKQLIVYNENIVSLNQQLHTLNSAFAQAKEEAKEKEQNIAKLQRKIVLAEKRHQVRAQSLTEAETRLDSLKSENEKLAAANAELNAANVQAAEAQARAETQNATLKQSLQDAQAKLKEQNDTISYLNSQLNSSILPSITRAYDTPFMQNKYSAIASPATNAQSTASEAASALNFISSVAADSSVPLSAGASRISQKYFSASAAPFFSPVAKASQSPYAPLPPVSQPVPMTDFTARYGIRSNLNESLETAKTSQPSQPVHAEDKAKDHQNTESDLDEIEPKPRDASFASPMSAASVSSLAGHRTASLSASFSTPASQSTFSVMSSTPASNYTEPPRSMVSASVRAGLGSSSLSLTPDSLGTYYRSPNLDGGAKSFYDRLAFLEPNSKSDELPSSFFPSKVQSAQKSLPSPLMFSASPGPVPASETHAVFSQSKEQIAV